MNDKIKSEPVTAETDLTPELEQKLLQATPEAVSSMLAAMIARQIPEQTRD